MDVIFDAVVVVVAREKVVEEAKTDETLRIELADELDQLKTDQKNLVVIFAARGPEEGATPVAQVKDLRLKSSQQQSVARKDIG